MSRTLIGLAVVAWAGAMAWVFWPAPPSSTEGASRRTAVADASAYVGNRACADCHPGEYALHAGSGHSQTLALAGQGAVSRRVDGTHAPDPEDPATLWAFALGDGRLEAERTRAGRTERQDVQFAFGSGHHAATFLSLIGNDPSRPEGLEHRMSYFARTGALGLTPGQRRETGSSGMTPTGRHFTADETRKCFECHTTLLSQHGQDTLDVATMLPNVTCERCHGPGRPHVEAARRGDSDLAMPFGPGRWTAAGQMTLCGQCHRLPEFVPPDQLYPSNPVLRRFQSVGLMQSKCYKNSRGALSCVTCHDPHARTKTDRAGYEAACLKCHQAAPQAVCRVGRSDCVGCHMPKREGPSDLYFADHWIRANPE